MASTGKPKQLSKTLERYEVLTENEQGQPELWVMKMKRLRAKDLDRFLDADEELTASRLGRDMTKAMVQGAVCDGEPSSVDEMPADVYLEVQQFCQRFLNPARLGTR